MKPTLLTYNIKSQSAKNLQKYLQEKAWPNLKRTKFPRANRFVINWGCSNTDCYATLNNPLYVGMAANKLRAFEALRYHEVATPDWTTDIDEAQQWIDEGQMVFGRSILNGHSGNGIVVFNKETIALCPLYVKYKKKKHEFRVHVFRGNVVDFQQKKKVKGEKVDNLIRNHHTGWVYCREDVTLPHDAEQLSIGAVKALGLDFGAVDIIYNAHENKSYVLEVNTAPGLFGSTIAAYGESIINAYKEMVK